MKQRWASIGTDVVLARDTSLRLGRAYRELTRGHRISRIEAEDHARLMSAAPELLDVCDWVLGCIGNLPKHVQATPDLMSARRELVEVIARARGYHVPE